MRRPHCFGLALLFSAFAAPLTSADPLDSNLTEAEAAALVTEIRNDPNRDPAYDLTFTELDAVDLVNAIPPDPEDPDYCEKRRDLCLAFTCGSFSPDHMPAACWEHCTQREFDRCEAESAE